MSANEEFATIVHDLRAPLRAILGYIAVIEKTYGAQLDAEGHRLFSVVCAESSRMDELLDGLKALYDLEARAVTRVPIDMNALVRDVARKQIRDGAVALAIEPLPDAIGDYALVRLVWENLLSNALKFSADSTPPRIAIAGNVEQGCAVYRVADNGVGFDAARCDKLFHVFARMHRTGAYPGKGMGLALARRSLALQDGRIWGSAKVGEGAEFSFALPAFDA